MAVFFWPPAMTSTRQNLVVGVCRSVYGTVTVAKPAVGGVVMTTPPRVLDFLMSSMSVSSVAAYGLMLMSTWAAVRS